MKTSKLQQHSEKMNITAALSTVITYFLVPMRGMVSITGRVIPCYQEEETVLLLTLQSFLSLHCLLKEMKEVSQCLYF